MMQFGHVLSRLRSSRVSCGVVVATDGQKYPTSWPPSLSQFFLCVPFRCSFFFVRYYCLCMLLFLDEKSIGAGNARLLARSSTWTGTEPTPAPSSAKSLSWLSTTSTRSPTRLWPQWPSQLPLLPNRQHQQVLLSTSLFQSRRWLPSEKIAFCSIQPARSSISRPSSICSPLVSLLTFVFFGVKTKIL